MAFSDVVAGITGMMGGLGQLGKDIRTMVTGKEPISADKAAEIALKVQELEAKVLEIESSIALAQSNIALEEAKSSDKFVRRWRPFIGWVCGFGCFYSYLVYPLITWLARVCFKYEGDFPSLDSASLTAMTMGMLGLVGARSFEKAKGVVGQH